MDGQHLVGKEAAPLPGDDGPMLNNNENDGGAGGAVYSSHVKDTTPSSHEPVKFSSGGSEASETRVITGADMYRSRNLDALSFREKAMGQTTCGFLPLVTDKLRNNVKNRLLLVLVYLQVVAIVAFIIVLGMYTPQRNNLKLSWAVPPPAEAYIGMPIPHFSAILSDKYDTPVEGVRLSVSMLPMKKTMLVATMPDMSQIPFRSLQCVKDVIYGDQLKQSDKPICLPQSFPEGLVMSQTTSDTNSFGISRFDNFTLGFGITTSYILVIQVDDNLNRPGLSQYHQAPTDLIITSYVEYKATVLSLKATSTIKPHVNVDSPFTVDVEATVYSEQRPSLATGMVLVTDLQPPIGNSPSQFVPWPLVGELRKDATFKTGPTAEEITYMSATTTNITNISTHVWKISLHFPTVQILSSNSEQLYLGVLMYGKVVVIEGMFERDYSGQYPEHFGTPFALETQVASALATWRPVGGEWGNETFSNFPQLKEQVEFQVKVQINDTQGRPWANRPVQLLAGPATSPSFLVTSEGPWSYFIAGSWPKQLLYPYAVTDENGVAIWPNVSFSVGGGIGVYSMSINIDGFNAVWAGRRKDTSQMMFVQSSIRFLNHVVNLPVRWTSSPWAPAAVKVLQQWERLPRVQALGYNGQPIPGKHMFMRPTSEFKDKVGISCESLTADSNGWIYPASLMVTWAVASGVYDFEIVVDDLAIYEFSQEVIVPSEAEALLDPDTYGGCIMADFEPFSNPREIIAGIPFTTKFITRGYNGAPVPGAEIVFEPYSAWQIGLYKKFYADSSGVGTLTETLGNIHQPLNMGFAIKCNRNKGIFPTYFTAVLSPRVSTVKLANSSADNTTLTFELDADWSHVSNSTPLLFQLTAIFAPATVHEHFTDVTMTSFYTPVTVTSSSQSTVTVKLQVSVIGAWMFVPSIDGSFFDVAIHLSRPVPVRVLTLQRSASIPSSYRPGDYFPVQPIVSVQDEAGHRVPQPFAYAQVGVRLPTGDYEWLKEDSNGAQWASCTSSAVEGDSNGVVTFTALRLGGARPYTQYKMRYCAYNNLHTNPGFSESLDACVEEPQPFQITEGNTITVSMKTVKAARGQYLEDFTVQVLRADGSGVPNVNVYFDFALSSRQQAQGATFLPSPSLATDSNGQLKLHRKIKVGDVTPDGAYMATVAGGGAISTPPFTILVTDSVAFVRVSGVPPPSLLAGAYNYSLQTIVPIIAVATTASGNGVAQQTLKLTIHRSGWTDAAGFANISADCKNIACGKVTSSSKTYAITKSSGVAAFPIAFEAMKSSDVQFKVEVGESGSELSMQQIIRADFLSVSELLGVSQEQLLLDAQARNNSMTPIISVFYLMSAGNGVWTTSSQESLNVNALAGYDADYAKTAETQFAQDVIGAIDRPVVVNPYPLRVYNPVNVIDVDNEVLPIEIGIHFSLIAGVNIGGKIPLVTVDAEVGGNLTFRDENGVPVPNATLTVQVYPADTSVLLFTNDLNVSDADGRISLAGLRVQCGRVGVWSLQLSSNGGGNLILTDVLVATAIHQFQEKSLMKYAAGACILAYSPLLAASVPYSRPIYSAVGTLLASAAAVGAIYAALIIKTDNILVNMYVLFIMAVAVLFFVVVIGSLIVDVVGRAVKSKRKLRWINDESKAVRFFKYTQWITNVDVDKQGHPPPPPPGVFAKMSMKRQDAKRRKLLQQEGCEEIDQTLLEMREKDKAPTRRSADRPVLWRPKEIPSPDTLPMNFLIVLGLAIVVVVIMTLCGFWLLGIINMWMKRGMNFLPNAQATEQLQEANKMIVQGLTEAIQKIVAFAPELQFLAPIVSPIQSIQLVQMMSEIRFYIHAFHERLPLGFGVGIGVALLSTLGISYTMTKKIGPMMEACRRGKYPIAGGGLFNSEVYIGLHMFCFIAAYCMVFSFAAAVTMILSVDVIRVYLWNTILAILIGSIGAIILQKGIVIFAKKLVTDGGYGVTRPELYNILHFVQLIMSIFTGLAKSISRWVTGIVLYTLMFARLDISIFPSSFTANDLAYVGFASVVIAESRLSNPLMLNAVALMLLEHRLKLLCEAAERNGEGFLVEVDSFGQGDYHTPAIIINLWRIYLRKYASVENSIEFTADPVVNVFDLRQFQRARRQKLERIRNRWWLLFLLHKNPFLRRRRKHYLIIRPEIVNCQ